MELRRSYDEEDEELCRSSFSSARLSWMGVRGDEMSKCRRDIGDRVGVRRLNGCAMSGDMVLSHVCHVRRSGEKGCRGESGDDLTAESRRAGDAESGS